MIKTKSLYKSKESEDGTRILISRLYPRGIKKSSVDKPENDNIPCKKCESEMSYIGNTRGMKVKKIAISQNPPSLPPDLDKIWTWDPVNGFIEPDVEINKLIENKRKLDIQKEVNDNIKNR